MDLFVSVGTPVYQRESDILNIKRGIYSLIGVKRLHLQRNKFYKRNKQNTERHICLQCKHYLSRYFFKYTN